MCTTRRDRTRCRITSGYPRTYGVGVQYNYYSGGYQAQKSVYGPYGTASRAAWYNPSTGYYGRAATVQTPAGGATVGQAYNPWTGTYAATRQGSNAYSQWGSSVAVRGNQWVQTAHHSTANGTVAGARTSAGGAVVGGVGPGGSGFVAKDQNNNVYAGKDGNVYKKDSGGSWQKYGNGGWSNTNPPATPYKSPQTPQQTSAAQARPTTQAGAAAQTRPTTQAPAAQTRPSGMTAGSAPQSMQSRPAFGTSSAPSAKTPSTPQARSNFSQPSAAAANPMQQLDRDAAARQRGAQQAQQYQRNLQSSAAGAGNRTSGQGPRRPR